MELSHTIPDGSYYFVSQRERRIREFKEATIEASKIAAEKYLTFLTTNSLMLSTQNYPYEARGGFSFSLVLVETSDGYYQEKVVRVIDEQTMVI